MPDRLEVSIVIATYNEEVQILDCLRSIFAAEPFAETFEVLVADGGSTDRTRELVAGFAADHPQVRLLDNPGRYAPHGFNTGIRASRGDRIFILGAHSSYDPSYFRLCLETARRTGADDTGGWVEFRTHGNGLESRLARALGSSPFGIASSPHRRKVPAEGPSTTAAFGCYKRSVFERFGLYDERLVLNQDLEFNQRILRGGAVIWMNPEIRISYFGREDLARMLRHLWTTGRWNAYTWKLAPHSFSLRHAIPAIFTASLGLPGLGLLALASHQTAALAAAAVEARRANEPGLAALLPPLFLAIHAAYGGGTFAGLLDLLAGRAPVDGEARIEYLPPLEPSADARSEP
jgi:glycosyltransferase involved in cell wall biosynthesis